MMAGPDKIMLIRHAEKSVAALPKIEGVDEDGQADSHSLTVRGWQRAGALVAFFARPVRAGIATPGTIFAAGTSDATALKDEESKSRRPVQTVAPLRDRLGDRTRWSTLPVDQVDELIAEIRGCDGVVLVCWEHKRIPRIAAGFVESPPDWGDRFDVVWVLDRVQGAFRLSVLDQDLLAGDQPATGNGR